MTNLCRRTAAALLVIAVPAGTAAQEALTVPRDLTTIACSDAQRQLWDAARQDLGVAGRDPLAGVLGYRAADKNFANDTAKILLNIFFPTVAGEIVQGALRAFWSPITGQRETVCGRVARYDRYDPEDKELDWCLYLVPETGRSVELVELAKQVGTPDCGDGIANCVEAEVTAVSSLHQGFHYFPDVRSAPGYPAPQACANGPFVADRGHGNHAEVHPAQLLWWRDECAAWDPKTCARSTLNMMIVQDDSDRYDGGVDFAATPNAPAGWRPWAESPVGGEFRIALSFPPLARTPGVYFVFEDSGERVVTSTASGLAPAGPTVIERGGEALYRAALIGNSDRIRIGFEEVCWDGSDLRGYLKVSAAVGEGDNPGYQLIKGIAAIDPVPRKPIEMLASRVTRVYRGEWLGRNVLLADLDVSARADAVVGAQVVAGRGEFRREITLSGRPGGGSGEGTPTQGVPAGEGVTVVAGESSLTVPGARLDLRVIAIPERPPVRLTARAGIASFARSAGIDAGLVSGGRARVAQVESWRVGVLPRYVPFRDGRVLREEEGPVSEAVNEALAAALQGTEQAVFQGRPFEAQWEVRPTSGELGGTEIKTAQRPTVLGIDTLQVQFDVRPTSAIEGARVSLRGSDRVVSEFSSETVVPRYVLEADDPNVLANEVTSIACKAKPCDGLIGRVQALAARAVEDRVVTPAELAEILSSR